MLCLLRHAWNPLLQSKRGHLLNILTCSGILSFLVFPKPSHAIKHPLKNIGVDAVGVRIDEIDGDPQVWLSQEVMFVLFLQGSGFVLDEPVLVEGVGDELGVEGDIREAIAVFDSADHSSP